MATITLKGVPDTLKERIKTLAGRERRTLNQQAILLLERALAEEPIGFDRAYRRFQDEHGASPLKEGDLGGLRGREEGGEDS